MRHRRVFILFFPVLVLLNFYSCKNSNAQPRHNELKKVLFDNKWDLSSADTLVALPSVLREISGMAPFGDENIACIQDESAKIYFLDSESLMLKSTHVFGAPDDYEAISCEDAICHVITSNKKLIAVPVLNGAKTRMNQAHIAGRCETESLTRYKDGWLTICKSGQQGEVFYMSNNGLEVKNLFKLSNKDVLEFLQESKPKLISRFKTRKEWIYPSDIFYYRALDHLYVVNGISKLLISVDMKTGYVLDAVFLDPTIFRQAEGVTVDQNDRLLISSEGSGTAGIMARFNRN